MCEAGKDKETSEGCGEKMRLVGVCVANDDEIYARVLLKARLLSSLSGWGGE